MAGFYFIKVNFLFNNHLSIQKFLVSFNKRCPLAETNIFMNLNRMSTKRLLKFFIFFLLLVSSVSCKEKDNAEPILIVDTTMVSFPAEGGSSEIAITSNDKWTISNAASSWLELSHSNGEKGSDTVHVTISPNNYGSARSTILVVNSQNRQSRRITISQVPMIYPSFNTSPKEPDSTGMSSSAVELAAKINLGWNIGNTFEAPGGETGWGNPVITESYIKFVKVCGFNAIRLPTAWNWYHMNNAKTAQLDANWLNRVKEVIGYCVDNDMYVLLNIHWDGGWLENNCTKAKQDSVNAKQKAIWEQIATTMRDFDEHLMFASANEPNTKDAQEMSVLLLYHQTFINAVRSTGGRNIYRTLVLQGAPELLSVEAFPEDPTPARIMYEAHNYTPFQFTALDGDADWGKMFYYWGSGHHSTIEPDRNPTWGEEDEQLKSFKLLKEQFVDKGIPVLLGEYGAYRRGGSSHVPQDLVTHNNAVDYWITYVTRQAFLHGVKPFFWDTGGIIDRTNNTVRDQRSLDAIIAGI
jgi:aryl-phospho-beta-D-glucosidase BglC (GH1 family)